jgi:phage gpG-like protein
MYDNRAAIQAHFKAAASNTDQMNMVMGNLSNMHRQAGELRTMLEGQKEVPEWVQEKLAVARSMLDSIYDYMQPRLTKNAGYTDKLPLMVGAAAGIGAAAKRYADARPREGGLSRLQVEARAEKARHEAHQRNEGQEVGSGLKARYLTFKNRVADGSAKETALSAAAFGVPIGIAAAVGTSKALTSLAPYVAEGPQLFKGTPLGRHLTRVGIK